MLERRAEWVVIFLLSVGMLFCYLGWAGKTEELRAAQRDLDDKASSASFAEMVMKKQAEMQGDMEEEMGRLTEENKKLRTELALNELDRSRLAKLTEGMMDAPAMLMDVK